MTRFAQVSAGAPDAPEGSGRLRAVSADAHDARALGVTRFAQVSAGAPDAPEGSGLSQLMLMMLGLWG